MYYCAIDPGAEAGFALIVGLEDVIAYSSVTHKEQIFSTLRRLNPQGVILGIEGVHAIKNAGAQSSFSFGRNTGYWIGILDFLGFQYEYIPILAWQLATTRKPRKPDIKGWTRTRVQKAKQSHKQALKEESLRAAQHAFPAARIPSHDVADAVNMARYLRMKHQGMYYGTQ